MFKITYLEASNGSVIAHTECGQLVVIRSQEQASALVECDLDNVYASSSMDFASEYGFPDNDAAWQMVDVLFARA